MWRVYQRAIIACALVAFILHIAPRAEADSLHAHADRTPQPRSAFDPASVLDFETAANQPSELPALSGIAFKIAAFITVTTISLISIWLWKIGRSPLGSQVTSDLSLRVSDSLTIAPGINIKALRTGSYQVLVGYDRHGLKGMLLLPDDFSDVLDAAESDLASNANQNVATVGALLDNSYERGLQRRDTEGATLRRTMQTNKRAKVPMDVGWDLNRSTT